MAGDQESALNINRRREHNHEPVAEPAAEPEEKNEADPYHYMNLQAEEVGKYLDYWYRESPAPNQTPPQTASEAPSYFDEAMQDAQDAAPIPSNEYLTNPISSISRPRSADNYCPPEPKTFSQLLEQEHTSFEDVQHYLAFIHTHLNGPTFPAFNNPPGESTQQEQPVTHEYSMGSNLHPIAADGPAVYVNPADLMMQGDSWGNESAAPQYNLEDPGILEHIDNEDLAEFWAMFWAKFWAEFWADNKL